MSDLPYMQFFPADYLRDTEILSLSAQGGWMRMLCSMWHPSRRGVLSLRLQAMARLLHASEQATKSIIDEIAECGVADVEWSECGGTVTITSRRMARDWLRITEERKELSAKRSQAARARWKDDSKRNANAMQVHSKCNAIPDTRIQNKEKETKRSAGAAKRQPLSLPDILDLPAFRAAWDDWQRHRSEIRKPLKPTMMEAQLAKFAEWGPQRSVAAIRHTIAMGWQGVREPEGQQQAPPAALQQQQQGQPPPAWQGNLKRLFLREEYAQHPRYRYADLKLLPFDQLPPAVQDDLREMEASASRQGGVSP